MGNFSPTAIPTEQMHQIGQQALALLDACGVARPEGSWCAGMPVIEYRDLTKKNGDKIDRADFKGRIRIGRGILTSGQSPFPADPCHLTIVRWGTEPWQCGSITVGPRTCLSAGGIISYTGVTIGDGVMFGPNVIIMDCDGAPADPTLPPGPDNLYMAPVAIEDHAWIGAAAILMPGVTIGHHATVSTMSVVAGDIPPHSLACGNPAKVIGRFKGP